jgi:hypothetical protein
MYKCKVCDAEIPDGVAECPSCKVHQEPPAKFAPGKIVKVVKLKLVNSNKGVVYYNYVVDSYFNQEIQMRMYRLNERLAIPIWREDWLEPVSKEEIERINASGHLTQLERGGFEHPLMEGVNM